MTLICVFVSCVSFRGTQRPEGARKRRGRDLEGAGRGLRKDMKGAEYKEEIEEGLGGCRVHGGDRGGTLGGSRVQGGDLDLPNADADDVTKHGA